MQPDSRPFLLRHTRGILSHASCLERFPKMELMKKVGKRSDNSSQYISCFCRTAIAALRETTSKGLATNTWQYSKLGSQMMLQCTTHPISTPPFYVPIQVAIPVTSIFRRVSRASPSALDRAADAGHRSPGFVGQLTSIAKSPRSLWAHAATASGQPFGGFTGTETLYSHLQALLVSSQAAGSKSHL